MQVIVNGTAQEVPPNTTVALLLEQLQIAPERIAVEINLTVIGRVAYHATGLNVGDQIEIISFIGGGGNGSG